MKKEEIISIFEQSGALLTGHFELRSKLHSNRYFQAALLLQYPDKAEILCRELADHMRNLGATVVISPAVGGLIVGQEVARALGVRAIFADKDDQGHLILKRGFSIAPGEKVIVAEDVVTKGGRVQETIDLVRAKGGNVVGAGYLVDRSRGDVDFGVPAFSLIKLDLPTFEPKACPMCAKGEAMDHPGSK
ncbi:MAG: orotate phosphoribosyltransferase [Victivallaceae bacterium]|nr:orotate phosphoribosyltransferase [Victivallaceae bacterium]